jgi:hypothetical protein
MIESRLHQDPGHGVLAVFDDQEAATARTAALRPQHRESGERIEGDLIQPGVAGSGRLDAVAAVGTPDPFYSVARKRSTISGSIGSTASA